VRNLTSEEQAKLDLLEIAGFHVEYKHGLFCVKSHEYFPKRMAGIVDENVKAFDSVDGVMGLFEFWKKTHGKD
jgi:hypothetical protein